MDSCIEELLAQLLYKNYNIIIRPHPQYIRRFPQKIKVFSEKHEAELNQGQFEFQTDFSSGDTVYQSDLVITDWSSISCEFAFATMKPVLFIDTPMKVINPHYTEYPMVPLDITLRNKIGRALALNEIETAESQIQEMLNNKESYQKQILNTRRDLMPNFGKSAEIGGKYILERLTTQKKG